MKHSPPFPRPYTVVQAPLALLALVLATLGLTACSALPEAEPARGMDYGRVMSSAMGRQMGYAVYTPPGWSQRERLPLVLFLHGGGDREDCFDRAGIGPTLDAAITSGDAPRAVICIPDGERGFWEDWSDGTYSYREWVMRDLLPHVRREYRTLVDRANTHVMGISMGGHGTLRLALLEGDSFASAAAISAPVMDAEHMVALMDSFWFSMLIPGDRIWGPTDDMARVREDDLFAQWREPEDLGGLRLMIAYGDHDRPGIIAGNRAFHEHLTARGIEHGYLEYDGAHKWVDWRPIFPTVLRHLLGTD